MTCKRLVTANDLFARAQAALQRVWAAAEAAQALKGAAAPLPSPAADTRLPLKPATSAPPQLVPAGASPTIPAAAKRALGGGTVQARQFSPPLCMFAELSETYCSSQKLLIGGETALE